MISRLLSLLIVLAAGAAPASSDWPAELPREGECVVCARRGADHGAERLVDWRVHGGQHFGFCSKGCGEAFDQMPEGYATPVLPRPAPDFAWSTLDGDAITPRGHRALLVDFWATWCTPCIGAMEDLEALTTDFGAAGLQVVGVSIDERRQDLDAFLRRRPLEYAIVHDGGEDPAWWQFRVPAIPAVFLLDAQGRIVDQWSGKVDGEAVRNRIEELLTAD